VPDVRRTVDAVWKLESARIVGGLVRLVRDVGLAEELAQDALVAALEQWPEQGVPDNPGAWLTTVARRRAVDRIRREQREVPAGERIGSETESAPDPQDDVLRLMFVSCHPVLSTDARVALTLRLLGGLTAAEIGRAFLAGETRIARRIAAAKQTLAAEGVEFELPSGPELAARLSSVLGVLYLIFNEGYSATAGDELIRADLCREALRLGRMLAELAPDEPEVHGLVALMEIQASRAAARTGPAGELVLLHEQQRGRWDQLLIRRGFAAMLRARALGGTPGPYVLQAAIAVCHAQARTAEETDWPRIATLYDALVRLLPTPVVRLNRAVALGMAQGPTAGLAVADELLADPALRDYHLLPAVRGDLLARLGRHEEAEREFGRAASLTQNGAEQAFLRRRATEMATRTAGAAPRQAAAGGGGLTLGAAAAAFLGRDDLSAATRRSYAQTLDRLRRALGERLPLDGLAPEVVAQVFATAWGPAAAKTWNRHRAAVRSFGAWARLPDPAAAIEARAEATTRVVPIAPEALAVILDDRRHALRERTFWRLLHESGAPVTTVLGLDVEDLDLDDRRARVGDGWVGWRAATARLLDEHLAGRGSGPLFRTERGGRTRLSYERAAYLFKRATGYTLRQLR